jgi:hypothetical protein
LCCREHGHLMRPADTRVRDHRAGLVAAAGGRPETLVRRHPLRAAPGRRRCRARRVPRRVRTVRRPRGHL